MSIKTFQRLSKIVSFRVALQLYVKACSNDVIVPLNFPLFKFALCNNKFYHPPLISHFQILQEFLMPRIVHNASLQVTEKDSNEEKDNNQQVLHLASAVAIAFLVAEYKVYLDSEGYTSLFQSLVPHFDVEKKSCAEFEGLIKQFPKECWM